MNKNCIKIDCDGKGGHICHFVTLKSGKIICIYCKKEIGDLGDKNE